MPSSGRHATTFPPRRRFMMDSSEPNGSLPESLSGLSNRFTRWKRQYQSALDRSTPHVTQRWLAFAGLLAVFALRILFAQGVCR